MYTYKNSFHNTEVKTKFSPEQLKDIEYRLASGTASEAEKSLARRMHKALCGSPDCTCSGYFGVRI